MGANNRDIALLSLSWCLVYPDMSRLSCYALYNWRSCVSCFLFLLVHLPSSRVSCTANCLWLTDHHWWSHWIVQHIYTPNKNIPNTQQTMRKYKYWKSDKEASNKTKRKSSTETLLFRFLSLMDESTSWLTISLLYFDCFSYGKERKGFNCKPIPLSIIVSSE